MARIWYLQLYIITTLFYLPIFTFAHPLDSYPTANNVFPRNEKRCSFVGNPDICGPGIRVGIYAQTLGVWLTKFFILNQAHVLRDSLTVFSLALLIVSIILAARPGSIDTVEFFIILQILSWNLATGVRARTSYSLCALQNREIRTLGMEAMNLASLSLHGWFWFHGLDKMKNGDENCTAKVFFFAETEIKGWFQVAMKVTLMVVVVEHGYDLGSRLLGAWGRGWWREKDKEIRRAVEEFEAWKKNKDMCRTEDTWVANSIHSSPVTASSTGVSNTTEADDENISVESTRIETQSISNSDGGQSPGASPSHEQRPMTTPSFQGQLFEDIYTAEHFLHHCTAASSAARFYRQHPILYKIFLHLLAVPRPQEHTKESQATHGEAPPYTACLKAMFRSIVKMEFPRRVVILSTHLFAIRTLDMVNGPYQVHAALHYPDPPPPHIIVLASQIQRSLLSLTTARMKYEEAIAQLAMHVFMILQIELTIKWNGITGLGGVDNVGQLIPLLVGVGGLILVAARGIEGVYKGEKVWENDKGREEGSGEWTTFVAAYEEWKEMLHGEEESQGTPNATI